MATPIKDLPSELIALIEARYVQQKRREGNLSCNSLPSESYEWNVGCLFTWRETPEHGIDYNFWSKVNEGNMSYVFKSPAYPKSARKAFFDDDEIDKQITEIDFYNKYWI